LEQGRRLKVSKAEKITDKVIEEKESNNTKEMRTMEPVSLWCIIFINCMTILSSIWILIRLYRNRSKRSASFYIYGIASLIGLFLGVISFFYHICHALCAIIIGQEAVISLNNFFNNKYVEKEQKMEILSISKENIDDKLKIIKLNVLGIKSDEK
jgi:hypothetical protein